MAYSIITCMSHEKHFTLICIVHMSSHAFPAIYPYFSIKTWVRRCEVNIFFLLKKNSMQCVKDIFTYVESPLVTFSRILSIFLDAMLLQLTSLSRAKHSNDVVLHGAVFVTLFAAEQVSYLPEETICSPRNVVNETVRAREAPANWNTRFFHHVSRNRGESRTERRRSLLSIGDPLALLSPRPLSPGAP